MNINFLFRYLKNKYLLRRFDDISVPVFRTPVINQSGFESAYEDIEKYSNVLGYIHVPLASPFLNKSGFNVEGLIINDLEEIKALGDILVYTFYKKLSIPEGSEN